MNPYSQIPVGVLGTLGLIYGLLLVLLLVSWWKIFVKMGEPGWKAIIPFYNFWVLVERLRKPRGWFWILTLGAVLITIGALWTQGETAAQQAAGTYLSGALIFVNLLVFALAIVLLVYEIKFYHALSKAFGHGAGFTVGLFLLPVIFVPILAFGPSRFQPEG